MFLKRIDVMGFKSFADKTTLEFSPGLTAVVGPNGSGKSNISDAIRWVLGEQSAKSLRGAKMEDVIFAGSESRKPINFCEVSLTLDNSDRHLPVVFDEVTVTRRVYRSGESEYLINKQSCRLKDIAELFMDSGLGRESYSIIGQGKIEEMLSTRPEDRRGPFEDAAGIVKYKFRRKEAERKLEETTVNVVRVDDLLAELDRQAGPLEKEAERATVFQSLEEGRQAAELGVLIYDIEAAQERWKQSVADMENLSADRDRLAEELVRRQTLFETRKVDLDHKSRVVDERQRGLVSSVEERERAEGAIALFQERLQNLGQSLVDRQNQVNQVESEWREVTEQAAALRLRLTEVRHLLEGKRTELEVAAAAVDPEVRGKLEQDIETLNECLIDLHHRAATWRNEIKASDEGLSADGRRQERLAAERERWETEREQILAGVTEWAERRSSATAERERCEAAMEDAARRLREGTAEDASLAAELQRLQADLASLRSRFELLKELEDGYDGYALGVKTILQASAKGQLSGIHGAVASLITVPQHLETAIEIALGGALQNIIVDAERDGRAAIDLLKRRQSGRATFMPLDVIRSRRLSAAELKRLDGATGFVGVASDLISCSVVHRPAVENLLGNVVVADTLANANGVARLLEYRVRVVTIEGDVVSPGGIMTGGSHQRKGPGLLGRTRERQSVEAKISDIDSARREVGKRQTDLRTRLDAIQRDYNTFMVRINELKAQENDAEARLRELTARTSSIDERLQSIAWENMQVQDGQTEWERRKAQAEAGLLETERQLSETEQQLRDVRDRLESWDKSVEASQQAVTAMRVEVATLTQEQDSLSERADEMDRRGYRLKARTQQLQSDIESLQQTQRDTEAELNQAVNRHEALTDLVAEAEQELVLMRQARQAAEADVAAAERLMREQQASLTACEDRLHRAEVMAERTDLELNHTLQKLSETYRMSYEWAVTHHRPTEDRQQLARKADKLKSEIAALGPVRAGAIEDFAQLSERIGFLRTERDDLMNAIDQLRSVIADIDEEMSKRFAQVFEQIRTEFEVAFRQLFNGGKADLVLTHPNDLLHTGIDVVAQPPGKKLQNLNLLSGGERALTAMALLFAILRVKPVPFCVLDEVEAALDEANVSRFAQQLRKFSGETQFIVITHRRGTMEEADALYGVTMQGSGVSSLVGVRLSDTAEIESA